MKPEPELMVTWTKNKFKLELFYIGKQTLEYKFYFDGKIVFKGDDYGPSPIHTIDGKNSIFSLLAFLSLRPGDTDKEYFEGYTPEQLEFCQNHAKELSLLVYDWETDQSEEEKQYHLDKTFIESNNGCTLTNDYFGTIQY